MAKLSAHGAKLGELDYLTQRVAFMSDGKILRNCGDGWKLYRTVKPGIDPATHWQARKARFESNRLTKPDWYAYRAALHDCASFSERYLVHACLEMLSNDPDGVWSELNDHAGIHLDIDECVQLCRLFDAAVAESKTLKNAQKEVAA